MDPVLASEGKTSNREQIIFFETLSWQHEYDLTILMECIYCGFQTFPTVEYGNLPSWPANMWRLLKMGVPQHYTYRILSRDPPHRLL